MCASLGIPVVSSGFEGGTGHDWQKVDQQGQKPYNDFFVLREVGLEKAVLQFWPQNWIKRDEELLQRAAQHRDWEQT